MAGIATNDEHQPVALMYLLFLERSMQRSLARVELSVGPLPPSELDQAIHILELALPIDALWTATRQLLLVLVPRMECDGLREELHAVLDAALLRCQTLGDRAAEAELRWNLGVLHQLQARFPQAQEQLEISVALYQALGAKREQARALCSLAWVTQRQRRLLKAEQLVAEAGRLLTLHAPERACLLNVKGDIAMARRQWHLARVCYAQELCLLHVSENQRAIAWACVNIGLACFQLHQYQQAQVWYARSIDLFGLIGDPVHCAVARMNLGIVFTTCDQPNAALYQYALAEPVFQATASVRRRAMVFNNIGYTYGLLQRWSEAEAAYRLAVELHQEAGNITGKVNTLDNLAESLEAQDRNDEAAAVMRLAFQELECLEPDAEWRAMYEMVVAHAHGVVTPNPTAFE